MMPDWPRTVREWKGGNPAAFDGKQRQAMDDVSTQLYELSKSIRLISENRQPGQGGTSPIVPVNPSGDAVTDGDRATSPSPTVAARGPSTPPPASSSSTTPPPTPTS